MGILYSVFDMRGHVDMDSVSKEFDDSRKEMDYHDSKEQRIDDLLLAKKMSDAMAAKLLCENSHLQNRVRELEEENSRLRKGSSSSITENAMEIKMSPRK